MKMTIILEDDLPLAWLTLTQAGETCLHCEYEIIPAFYLRE